MDPLDIGAQALALDYEFLGAGYDAHDGRVQILLGSAQDTRQHVSHSIAGAGSIEVLQGSHGRDTVVRISGAGEQMLMTFTS